MSRPVAFSCVVALGTIVAIAATGLPAAASKNRMEVECQRPMTTGEEAIDLKNVSAAVACPLVRDLGHWEYKADNITKLYRCDGPGRHTPVLKLARFEGWRLSVSKAGYFQMSHGESSFAVIGTDFPLNCS
jgi:hypothetical protein